MITAVQKTLNIHIFVFSEKIALHTYSQQLNTYDSGHHLEAEHWVVLEELDEREGYQGKVLHLPKDGCPVS